MTKRIFDIFFASLGIIILLPLFIFIAITIKVDSKGPIFFRQERVGQYGKVFRIHKFRTMSTNSELTQSQLTIGNDPRITRIGHYLRKTKLDELAQLIDVVLGQMSLVGPRPEVPKYVAHYPENIKTIVLSVRPGITDLASIKFKDESTILGNSSDPEKTYIVDIIPKKTAYYVEYVENNSLLQDVKIIISTIKAIF